MILDARSGLCCCCCFMWWIFGVDGVK